MARVCLHGTSMFQCCEMALHRSKWLDVSVDTRQRSADARFRRNGFAQFIFCYSYFHRNDINMFHWSSILEIQTLESHDHSIIPSEKLECKITWTSPTSGLPLLHYFNSTETPMRVKTTNQLRAD